MSKSKAQDSDKHYMFFYYVGRDIKNKTALFLGKGEDAANGMQFSEDKYTRRLIPGALYKIEVKTAGSFESIYPSTISWQNEPKHPDAERWAAKFITDEKVQEAKQLHNKLRKTTLNLQELIEPLAAVYSNLSPRQRIAFEVLLLRNLRSY